METGRKGHGQGLSKGPSPVGELGPPHRHFDRRRLRRNQPGGPQSVQRDEIGQGDRGTSREGSGPEDQKNCLNRSLQDAALGRLAYWICVRAQDAGRRVWMADPKNSSRQCAPCGHSEAANRHGSRFACLGCGHAEHADVHATQVVTARGQAADTRWKGSGRPLLTRPVPKGRRPQPAPAVRHRLGEAGEVVFGAGSAPHAVVG
jgi:transposase